MKAWICDSPTGVDAITWTQRPTPMPKADELLIRVAAAGLNFPDLLIVQNKYQFKPEPPFVPGAEFAGVIEVIGEAVSGFYVGQSIACLAGVGGFATHAVVKAALCMPVPDAMPLTDAAALIMTYGTGHHALYDRAQLKAGETLLVLGAAGGVGTAAIQLGKALGAHVIAAASGAQKCALCAQAGADQTIDYGALKDPGDIREAIKSLTAARGVDVVYDPVGGDWAEPVFRSLAWRGRYLVIGFAAGQIPRLPLNLALLKGASVVGVFYGGFAKQEPGANAAMLRDLARLCQQGRIKPVIETTLPMSELKQAYAMLQSRSVMGKLVLHNNA